MMKNKVIEMMAKDWNAYTDAFSKKDDCVYVVVDNSNDSVEKFYKSWRGAYSYIEKTYDKFTYGLSKKGIVIINRKEVEDYIETINKEKETENNMPLYNIGDIFEGYVSTGEKNPFYNDKIKLVVKRVVKTMWGCNIEVETIEKRTFEHHVDTFNKRGKLMRTEKKYKRETWVGWLDQSKEFKKIYDAKRGY